MMEMKDSDPKHVWIIVCLILFVNLILSAPALMPEFDQINAFDEIKYNASGSSLTKFEVRDLSWAPVVSLLYAPLHAIIGSSPSWFILEAWASRFVLHAFMWASIVFLAWGLRSYLHPYVAAGVLFTTTAFFPILENQSDALYLALSALSLGITVRIFQRHKLRDVTIASLLAGLAVLTRVEALPTLGSFLLLLGVLEWRHHRARRLVTALSVPGIAAIALDIACYSLSLGRFEVGSGGKAWASFETNQPVPTESGGFILTGGTGGGASEENQRLYGTKEENDGSVLKAISRNPRAFARRILINLKALPDSYLAFFGKRLGPITLLNVLWGFAAILRGREFKLMGMALIWSIPAFISLGFFSRHFIHQTSHLILILSAVGVASILAQGVGGWRYTAFTLATTALMLWGLLDDKPGFLAAGFIPLAALSILWLMRALDPGGGPPQPVGYLVLFSVGLILLGGFPFLNLPGYGTSPREQAVHYLQDTLPEGSKVFASTPLTAVAAGMLDVRSLDGMGAGSSPGDLAAALEEEGIRAVILDSTFSFRMEGLDDALADGIGEVFELGFEEPTEGVRMLLMP